MAELAIALARTAIAAGRLTLEAAADAFTELDVRLDQIERRLGR